MKEKQSSQYQDKVKKEPQEPIPDTIKQVEELEKSQAALAEANDKYMRLYAEFENFRRRAAKEKLALMETANEDILKQLLPIIDDFERSVAALQQDDTPAEAMQEGIKLVYDKLMYLLQRVGVQPMELTKGIDFDAELHEVVSQAHVEDKVLQGKVVDILEKGYCLKDKVLRFAKVVTGS